MHTLAASHIVKQFTQGDSTISVLSDISYMFVSNASYAITGASGCGKSTFMHILACLDQPTRGQVLFNDKPVETFDSLSREVLLNQKIGLVFQEPFLIDELSVLENVMLKGLIAGRAYQDEIMVAQELLERFELADKAGVHPRSLSGGQQQRVAIARALFNRPQFLLADEPTGNLDERMGRVIIQLMIEHHQRYNMGLIIASHDAYVARAMQHQLTLNNGVLQG